MKYLFFFCAMFLLAPLHEAHAASIQKLSVPFTSQAPFANWNQPWQDACEEATIVMVDHFYRSSTLSPVTAHDAIIEALSRKESVFGFSYDEPAWMITELINRFYPFEAYVVEDPTLAEMKAELDAGRPMIFLGRGVTLQNPFFYTAPPYHTVVITGYDDEKRQFITNEPGTRRGLDFRYSYATLSAAMADFVPGMPANAPRRIVFTTAELKTSAQRDDDRDGLSKVEEVAAGTSLVLADTDGDGVPDGKEMQTGSDPLVFTALPEPGALIKSPQETTVYVVLGNQKRPILSEAVFLSNGWRWQDVRTLDPYTLQALTTGELITRRL